MEHQALLSLIREKLNQLGPEAVLEKLYEFRTEGPTAEYFLESKIEYADFYDEAYSVPFNQDVDYHSSMVAANDESAFDAWEECSLYDMAA